MQKNIVFLSFAILAGHSASMAQQQNLSALFFEVSGKRIYQVQGASPGTGIEFYADNGGGKLLQTNTAGADGRLLFNAALSFSPAFALNRGGGDQVSFIGQREFLLKDISPGNSETRSINWTAAFSHTGDYEMELLRSDNQRDYTVVAVMKPVVTNEYKYSYTDLSAADWSALTYKIRIRNTQKGIDYLTEPAGFTAAGFSVFPTLAASAINLRLDQTGDGAEMKSYTIINSLGQVVQKGILSQKNLAAVSIEGLAAGAYTVSMITGKDEVKSAGFVKM